MTRIVITGGPRTGKTTLALGLGMRTHSPGCPMIPVPHEGDCTCSPMTIRHTDDLIEQCKNLGKDAWSEASRIASTWLDETGPWIIEGVAASRALRKWRDAHPGEPPVDRVIYLAETFESPTKGQIVMAKGVETVHREIEGWLAEHGVRTEFLTLREMRFEYPGLDGIAKL